MSEIAQQRIFMKTFGLPAPKLPTYDGDQATLWLNLMVEEINELQEAWLDFADNPESNAAQAELTAEIIDVLYVVMGFGHSQGLPLGLMFQEIHDANMRKRSEDGSIKRNAAGKVLKPEGWHPADKRGVISLAESLAKW
jgi:predicted HAD superfamily Cof-like phosphohydrolase